jgi:hypothetical protein
MLSFVDGWAGRVRGLDLGEGLMVEEKREGERKGGWRMG